MKKSTLHELAKVGVGLVFGDFLYLIWSIGQSVVPVNVLGMQLESSLIAPAIIFDLALLLILVHYGWNIGKTPRLRAHAYFLTIGSILTIIAIAHLVRIFTGSDFVLLNWTVPLWISGIGTVAAAYLAYMSFTLSMKIR
jgi:hypothetical protein